MTSQGSPRLRSIKVDAILIDLIALLMLSDLLFFDQLSNFFDQLGFFVDLIWHLCEHNRNTAIIFLFDDVLCSDVALTTAGPVRLANPANPFTKPAVGSPVP